MFGHMECHCDVDKAPYHVVVLEAAGFGGLGASVRNPIPRVQVGLSFRVMGCGVFTDWVHC